MQGIKKLLYFISLILLSASCTGDYTDNDDLSINKSANFKSLGASANDLLSDENFTSINIEIVYVEGYPPSPIALDGFKNFLEQRTYKPDGINISLRAVGSSNKAPFDIDEIAEIEKELRSVYNAGDEIGIYIYYADGSHEEDEDSKIILGSAFRNTSMVIYKKTIEDYANRPNAPNENTIETAVLNHEFGHLFGLVGIGTTPQSDHKDGDNEGHCTEEQCLMRASIEFGGSIVDEIVSGNIPELGPQCINDLQANGGR